MRHAYYIKTPRQILEYSTEIITSDVKWRVGALRRKGFVTRGIKAQVSDSNGNDFAQNIVTVMISFDAYKAPRIILKNKRFNRASQKKLIRLLR